MRPAERFELRRGVSASRLIVALDLPDIASARAAAAELAGLVHAFKIGHELLYTGGESLARELVQRGERVFIDAKLLDIDNTVERAVRAIAAFGATYLTIHAHDKRTAEAAQRGRAGSPLQLLGITVLTSLAEADIAAQGFAMPVAELVGRRAAFARAGGLDGVVASARETAWLRAAWPEALIVTPGIRREGDAAGDQARTATPAEAIAAGADLLVIGRPILAAPDRRAAAQAFADECAKARTAAA